MFWLRDWEPTGSPRKSIFKLRMLTGTLRYDTGEVENGLMSQTCITCLVTCNKLGGIIRLVVLTSLTQSRYNKNVTRLTTQVCNNIVISRLYRTCWNNLVSTKLLQLLTRLSILVDNWLGTSSANTTCWRFLADLLQDVRFWRVYGNSNSTRVYLFTALSILIYEHEMSFQNFKTRLAAFQVLKSSYIYS